MTAATPAVDQRGEREPWTGTQRRALVAAEVVAAVLIGAAWAGARGTTTISGQVGWVNLAVAGLLLGGAANGAWLALGRRSIGRRRLHLCPDVVAAPTAAGSARGPYDGPWLRVPAGRRAHVPTCPMVAGRTAVTVDRAAIAAEQLVRCEVCG